MSGTVTAEDGLIGGFIIGSDTISASSGQLQLKSSGQITASAVSMSGDIVATNITAVQKGNIGGFEIGSDIISASSGNLILKSSGQLTASAMSMSGTIKATGGEIGGFVITSDRIQTSDGTSLVMNSAGQITGSDVLFSGGTITSDVTIQGDLSATSISTPSGGSPLAVIDARGFAKFVSASIAGFHITDSFISASSGQLTLKSSGQITASAVSMSGTVTADDGKIGGFIIGSDTISASAGTLHLKSSGQITASAVSMSGTITADSGEIAGWEISDGYISKALDGHEIRLIPEFTYQTLLIILKIFNRV
jgi:hypothetical protein